MRDDAKEKLSHAITLIEQAEDTSIPAMRSQHLTGAIRLIEMVRDSLPENDIAFRNMVGERPN